ncbi:hypothetical protein CCP3SC1AL1_4520002 [Gammaproteobacteria bacterium]
MYFFYITQNLKIDNIAKHYGCHRTVICASVDANEFRAV